MEEKKQDSDYRPTEPVHQSWPPRQDTQTPASGSRLSPLPDGHVAGQGPGLTTEQALGVVATKLAPKVTEAGIKAKIDAVRYLVDDITTVCFIHMQNGYKVIGHATPASPANFDPEVGKRLAYDAAFRQLWPLEGYLLRERLSVAPDTSVPASPAA